MMRQSHFPKRLALRACLGLIATGLTVACCAGEEIDVSLRFQEETSPSSGRYHLRERQESWNAEQTAVIVCDMWDLHHCLNAVRRERQFAPRLNELLTKLRDQGVTVIHAPSGCMDSYANHPARMRAANIPLSTELPPDITSWCSQIPAEEHAVYPVDQSDGGEDDDPQEHAAWEEVLESLGRNPKSPWKHQIDMIAIDSARDYISDRGDEVWSILERHGVTNVLLTGVHTNMCVLGRPFGLRQMARNGKNVVLVRDLTDTMYNPQAWPFVNHFTGTDLIVSHIERHVCPTITSDQILGGTEFRFKKDGRPHVAFVIAEDEYETEQTLPEFAAKHLGKDFRVTFIFGGDDQRNRIPGLKALDDVDVMFVSVRRRVLPSDQLDMVRMFVRSGKPVIGIRTASHAFSLRDQNPESGLFDWPEFDAEVFGGNYTGHHGNQLKSTVRIVSSAQDNPIVEHIDDGSFVQGGSLYKTSPLAAGTRTLLQGEVEGQPIEPVAWTFVRKDGGRSFYTSLGHRDDFQNEAVVQLLINALRWATDR